MTLYITPNSTGGGGGGAPSGPAGGALTGSYPNPGVNLAAGATVSGLLPVAKLAPSGTNSWVLTTVAGIAVWAAAAGGAPTGAAGGSLGGSYPNPTVVQIDGTGGTVKVGAILTGNSGSTTPLAMGVSNVLMPLDANYVLTATDYASGPFLRITSTPTLTAPRTVTLPSTVTGAFFSVYNNTTGGQSLTFLPGATVLPPHNKAILYYDGANYVAATPIPGGDLTPVTAVTQLVNAINGASVPASGALTSGNVLQVTGVASLGYAPVNLAGGANFVTGSLPSANQAAQTMGGDVTGTTAASTVAKINGSTVPAGGALTTGNVLQVTGAGALGYAALNLAGGAAFVTGALAAANFPTLTGDVTTAGASLATTVAAISGASPIAITPNNFQWIAGATPNLSQVAAVSGAGTNFTISPQAPTTTGAAGSLVVAVAAPASGTVEAGILFSRNAAKVCMMQAVVSTATAFALYCGATAAGTPSSSNYAFRSDGAVTQVVGSTSVSITSSVAATGALVITGSGTSGLGVFSNALAWDKGATTPSLTQVAQASTAGASGSAGTNASIAAQAGQAATGAAHNGGNGANLAVSSGAGGTSGSATAGTPGKVNVQVGGTTQMAFSPTSLQPAQSAIALATGSNALTAAQQQTPALVFSGTPGAGTCTIALGGVIGMYWLDFSQVTLGATIYIITNGAGSVTVTSLLSASKTGLQVTCNTAATLAVS